MVPLSGKQKPSLKSIDLSSGSLAKWNRIVMTGFNQGFLLKAGYTMVPKKITVSNTEWVLVRSLRITATHRYL